MSFDNKNGDIDLKKTHEELASNYALQVALQTMKERCQQLQSRLSVVEDENLQLKIEKQKLIQHETKVTNLCDVDKLQEQIAQLNRQKSQLTHHIYMVATENKHLWTRLSLLTEANESLGTRLNKISNTLSNQTLSKSNPLNNEQYTEITDLSSVKDFDFSLTHEDDEYSDSEEDENPALIGLMLQDLKQYKEQFLQCLSMLKQQQDLLKDCYNKLKVTEGSENCNFCSNCKSYKSGKVKQRCDVGISVVLSDLIENDTTESEEIHKILASNKLYSNTNGNTSEFTDDRRICPICGISYPFNGDFNIFVNHVQEHFPEEEEEMYQSDSLLYGGSSSLI